METLGPALALLLTLAALGTKVFTTHCLGQNQRQEEGTKRTQQKLLKRLNVLVRQREAAERKQEATKKKKIKLIKRTHHVKRKLKKMAQQAKKNRIKRAAAQKRLSS